MVGGASKENTVFVIVLVSNAEPRRAQSYAESVKRLPLRFSAVSASPR